MRELVVVADLGAIHVYKVVKDPLRLGSDRLEPIKNIVTIEPHMRASGRFSDSAGRFYQGGGTTGTAAGFGEPHNTALEAERRIIKRIVDEIKALVDRDCEAWLFAADRSVINHVLGQLDASVRAKLRQSVPADLTKVPRSELMEHFIEREAA